jgi:sterol desaturase/sphingolipid hydroxylase (fatty acid hydroxylase superfamily)
MTPSAHTLGSLSAVAWSMGAAALMIIYEAVRPAVRLGRVRGWWPRAIALNLFQVGTVFVAGLTWNRWLQGKSILNAGRWPFLAGVLATYVFSTFVFYWWHRIRHESPFWWRFAHQIHHSVTRLELVSSFYKHPLEIWINSILSAVIVYPIMGCTTAQASAYTMAIALGEMFYHWNIHTFRWVGVIFQRPESHRIHHQKEMHSHNYSDLPVWDWVFGTFSNPKNADRVLTGFSNNREAEIGAMLLAREVDTTRRSEPLDFRPACFGCPKRRRCENPP